MSDMVTTGSRQQVGACSGPGASLDRGPQRRRSQMTTCHRWGIYVQVSVAMGQEERVPASSRMARQICDEMDFQTDE